MPEDALLAELMAEVKVLREKVNTLEKENDHLAENQNIQLELIGKLRNSAASPKGAKTLARIAKIDEILKARGATTLKELERVLAIDRATMTRLLGKLDKRRYELHSRPGDDREKVLRLKVQIR